MGIRIWFTSRPWRSNILYTVKNGYLTQLHYKSLRTSQAFFIDPDCVQAGLLGYRCRFIAENASTKGDKSAE